MWIIKAVFQKQLCRLEKFHPSVSSAERFDGGCTYLERERGNKEQHTEVPLPDDVLFLLCASPK